MNAIIKKKPGNWDIDQSSAIGPQVIRILRERIIYNDLRPGAAISESAMAMIYQISRQPVREAFIRLADEGLLEIRPQRKTLVKKISYAAVLDARFVREAVEADIVKLLAESPDPSLVSELRRQLRCQAEEISSPVRFIRRDEQFHRTLAEAAGKRSAWQFIEEFKTQMDRVRILRLQKFPVEKLIKQHGAIVDSIESGEVGRAEKAVRYHLQEILRVLPQIYSENMNFFDGPDIYGSFNQA